MGETLDVLMCGRTALDLVEELDDDIRLTLSVIAYSNNWDYASVRARQRWLKQKYDKKIEQSTLFRCSPGIEPLWWLDEAYHEFIKLEIPPYWAKNKARIQENCRDLLGSLHHLDCVSLYEQETKENSS
jgi:hypothetical protein